MSKNNEAVKLTHLEAMAKAALGGHDLAEWKQTRRGWQARCRLCQMATWIGDNGLSYSLLDDKCSGDPGTGN